MRITIALLALSLSACAGRDANPIRVAQASDSGLTCRQIEAEMTNNESEARRLAGQKSDNLKSNGALGLVGAALFWPALFFLDLGEAERQEIAALRERNDRLSDLQVRKHCI